MKKILLVEDDEFLIDIYKTKLEESKFEVVVESNGSRAVEIVKKEKPDLVLLDIVLPNQDGWEILRNLKKEGIMEKTKVAILSNLGQKEEIEKGLALGASLYLIKAHYTPSQVVQEISHVV